MIPQKLKEILTNLKSLDWLKQILQIANVYVVGGTIRDAFLGKPMKDIDLIVEGLSLEKIKDLIRPYGKVDIVGESFSVIKFKPSGFQGEPYDIATPRMDRKIGKGHKGFEIITDGIDILTDLKRRDFTINSIAVNIKNNELVDPFNGIKDIDSQLLRATDERAFIEDPLRILRGIQFAARFGYKIAYGTLRLMKENAHLIKTISGERIFEELMKILNKEGNTQIALNLLHETDVDKAFFDKKMLNYDKGFDYLDPISFFYVLGLLGDVDPGDFIRNRLKGDAKLEKNVRTVNQIFSSLPLITEEVDLRFMLSKAFTASPKVMDAVILPEEVNEIILQMRLNKIPKNLKDIAIDGDDVQRLSNYSAKGPEVGLILEKVLRDALMNEFDWGDREKSLLYLKDLLYNAN